MERYLRDSRLVLCYINFGNFYCEVTQHFHRGYRPYDITKLATGNFRNCNPLGGEASPP